MALERRNNDEGGGGGGGHVKRNGAQDRVVVKGSSSQVLLMCDGSNYSRRRIKNRQLTAAVRQTGRERIFVSHFHVVVGKINANGKTLSCQSQCVCRSEERRGEERRLAELHMKAIGRSDDL